MPKHAFEEDVDAAKTAAENAQKSADTAKAQAETATFAAATAKADAASAKADAASAKTSSSSAMQSASEAKTAAATAQSTANSASTKATDADAMAAAAKTASDANTANGVTKTMLAQSAVPSTARIRVEKNVTPLVVSNTWQRLIMGDSNPLNGNTFPVENGNAAKTVTYDATTGLFKFLLQEERTYGIVLDFELATTNLLTGLLGTSVLKLQWRFVIPNGRAPGSNFHFPFPGQDGANGYGEFGPINLTSPNRYSARTDFFANDKIRANGLGIDVRLSQAAAGMNLVTSTVNLYGR